MAVLLAEYPPEWKEGWEVTEQLLDSVAKECGAAGSRFLTMLAPSQVQVVPDP